MPIYAYRCEACGLRKDVLQKMSDPALTVCPACGAASFAKQLSAPAFQLKGTGWYATDFRDNGKKPEVADAAKSGAVVPAGEAGAAGGDAAKGAVDKKSDGKDGASVSGAGAPAATPAAAKPVDKPGSASGSSSTTGSGSSAA
jgi:putative FmdB family regulatory protein